jgi:protein-disulfide isomerase
MIEYTDFECPFCGQFSRQILPRLRHQYLDKGLLSLVLRNLPSESIHPNAMNAAKAARCAQAQDRYDQMHESLFNDQHDLSRASLFRRAEILGLTMTTFEQCFEHEAEAQVRKEVDDASSLGITGTPFFVIGSRKPDGSVQPVTAIYGARPITEFQEAIAATAQTDTSSRQ